MLPERPGFPRPWSALRRASLRTKVTSSAVLALLLASRAAHADSEKLIEGDVPTGAPDHFFVPFDVPPGTREIEIVHDDLSEANILDFGLDDAAGYRGWGGGTDEPVVVNEKAASRAYVPGPLDRGGFKVVVGKAKIVASPAKYRILVRFRDAPTLAPQTERKPFVPGPALRTEARWYAGDFHVHSKESTDAKPSLDEIAAFARSRKLDFVEVSDHNTVTQLDYFVDAQSRQSDFLFVPGVEFTTYAGHANAIGATRFVDHRIGQPGATIEAATDAVLAQGAVFSINHPMLDLGDVCIGCAWKHTLLPEKIGGYEIGTGGQKEGARLFLDATLASWEALLDRGSHAAALGGGDDHTAGKGTGAFASPIGSPTTLVYARELSVPAILDAVLRGRTVVKLQGPDDPMVELGTEATSPGLSALPGDTLAARSVRFTAKVTGGLGQRVRFVRNGTPEAEQDVTRDPFVASFVVAADAARETRVRAEVLVDEKPRTVTSHVFLRFDAQGPEAASAAGDEDLGGGCSVGSSPKDGTSTPLVAFAPLAAGLVRLVLRRRAVHDRLRK
jgi:hypothetical protein